MSDPMDRYVILGEILGTGANGTVGKAMEIMTGNIFAIKKLKRSFSTFEECLSIVEVRCMRELIHPNIVSLHEVIMESNTLYLVLECMDCDLTQLMRLRGHPFSEQEVRNLFIQLFKGLAYMHEKGYCHRDLKPNNLLVCGDTIKIADFGLARNLLLQSGQPLQSYVVTRPYRAPELLLGSTDYDFAIDIWSMGVIMAQLLTGYNLFGGSREVDQIYKICSVIGCPNSQTWLHGLALAASLNYNFPKEFRFVDVTKRLSSLIPRVSAEAIDLIKLMLSWDPKSRPTARKALQHPFFVPGHITNNNPIPPPVLQSAYQSPVPPPVLQSAYQSPIPPPVLQSAYQSPVPPPVLKSAYQSPIPPPVLQSAYQSSIEKHSEVQEQNPRPNNNGEHIHFSNAYSVWKQIIKSMPQSYFPVVSSCKNSPLRVTKEISGSDPLSFSSACAIWRQITYKGPYRAAYLASSNVRPFPSCVSRISHCENVPRNGTEVV